MANHMKIHVDFSGGIYIDARNYTELLTIYFSTSWQS